MPTKPTQRPAQTAHDKRAVPAAPAPIRPRVDLTALGARIAEIERAMGVKPILVRTRPQIGY